MATNADILVTGDFVTDHHLLKGNKSEAFGIGNIGTKFTATFGGAKLTFDLAEYFMRRIRPGKGSPKVKCYWPFPDRPELFSSEGTDHDSYLRWEIKRTADKKDEKNGYCLRLFEKLGFGSEEVPVKSGWFSPVRKINSGTYRFILIDEAGIGFRNHSEAWPDFNRAEKIILKTTFPLCEGPLWRELSGNGRKLVTIVNLNQIKHYNIRISNGISWEQTALDIVYGIHKDPVLKNLLRSGELIITIGTAGAVLITTGENPDYFKYRLIFDPENMEEEWEENYDREIINLIGLGSSFLAGFSGPFCAGTLTIKDCIKVGLNTMVAATVKGVFELSGTSRLKPKNLSSALFERYFHRYYASAFIPSPAWSPGLDYIHNQQWSILENNYDNRKINYIPKSDLYPLAFSLALSGTGALHYAPRLSLGKTTVFDRNEIENLRNLHKLIEFYDKHEDGKKPLNIAVFGPPGTGKSFIIKALASDIFKNSRSGPSFLTFNLSQIREESELPGAFHNIRDEVLKGRLPFVFWDEFDSDDYRWLKSFIAPMQDGTFQEGKETHPIGKSIFVFAGSMTYTMNHLSEKMTEKDLVWKKGPDFLSRISGYLNVFGPNRKPWFDSKTGQWCREGDPEDNCFSIRRALFIRHVLRPGGNIIDIDLQLLRTLIEVCSYKSGARGLDRLLTNLSAHSGRKIELSDLPSKEIIQMNVDYNDFMTKLEDSTMKERISLEKLAFSIHKYWLNMKVRDSIYYEDYWDLNFDGRLDNIKAAERIGEIVAVTGVFAFVPEFYLLAGPYKDAIKEFEDYIKNKNNLDMLAEKEHEGWMKARQAAGWLYGTRSDYNKIHPCLIPWHDLDPGIIDRKKQDQKNKDRNTIEHYTSILKGSGYTIILI